MADTVSLLTASDIDGRGYGGLLREDVMDKIWDISKIPLPFTDLIGTEKSTHPYKEWTIDTLASPDLTNAVKDGADTTSDNDQVLGYRNGNHHQISTKTVQVSTRSQSTNNIGRSNELAYQVMRRQQELRRDVEAIALSNQSSLADDGGTNAGTVGGLPGWLTTNVDKHGSTTGGGFSTTTGLVTKYTTGGTRALTETIIRNLMQTCYSAGGNPSVLMSVPALTRRFSEYLFTSSARVATLMSDQGKSGAAATAVGAVNVFVTDFGTLKIVPNRIQQLYSTTRCDVFLLDPSYLAFSYLKGYRTEELAKTGLADKRQMSVDWTLCVFNEAAHALAADIGSTTTVTA